MKDTNTSSTNESQFNIQLIGYEGPIDLLLELARKQKVNLSDISILQLAEQYIDFINNYKKEHLEIAADYLVMAAWLTYLKSRLLLPKEEKTDDHSSDDLEKALIFQLQRLESIQNISKKLYKKPIVYRDVFYGGTNEGINIKYNISYTASLFELLQSYALLLNKQNTVSTLTINSSELFTVDQAIERMKIMFGSITEWTNFMNLIPKFGINRIINKSSITSNFVASLELAKNGLIEVKQNETFGNIFVKAKSL